MGLPSADPLLGAKWIADFLGKEIPADLQELAVLRSPSLAVPKRALELGRVIRVSRAKPELTEEQKLNTANCVWDSPGNNLSMIMDYTYLGPILSL